MLQRSFLRQGKKKVSSQIDNHPETAYEVNDKKYDNSIFEFHKVLDIMIESLNHRFDKKTKKIIFSTGKMMTLGLGNHELSNGDF